MILAASGWRFHTLQIKTLMAKPPEKRHQNSLTSLGELVG
jgi:hypothetical protein